MTTTTRGYLSIYLIKSTLVKILFNCLGLQYKKIVENFERIYILKDNDLKKKNKIILVIYLHITFLT